MSLFGLKFEQMILHTETSKRTCTIDPFYLYFCTCKPTLLPSTFNIANLKLQNMIFEDQILFGMKLQQIKHVTNWWQVECRCQDFKRKSLTERWVPGKTMDAFKSFLWDLDNKSMGILYMASYCIKVKGNVEYW